MIFGRAGSGPADGGGSVHPRGRGMTRGKQDNADGRVIVLARPRLAPGRPGRGRRFQSQCPFCRSLGGACFPSSAAVAAPKSSAYKTRLSLVSPPPPRRPPPGTAVRLERLPISVRTRTPSSTTCNDFSVLRGGESRDAFPALICIGSCHRCPNTAANLCQETAFSPWHPAKGASSLTVLVFFRCTYMVSVFGKACFWWF